MLVKLPNQLTIYTGGKAELTLEGCHTPKTALTKLVNSYPNLYIHLFGPDNNARKYAVVIDDEFLLEGENVLQACEELEFVEVASGELPIPPLIIAAWAAIGITSAVAVSVLTTIIFIGLMVGLSMLASMIMGSPDAPSIPTSSGGGSSTYSFQGVRNTTAPGSVVPVVYGKHRVGGQVLAISVYSGEPVTKGDTTEYFDNLKVTLALSEGPIKNIYDVLIDGMPISYFDGWSNVVGAIQPFAYTLGGGDVSIKVGTTAVSLESILGRPVHAPDNDNVVGSMLPYDVVENTHTIVSNATIKSVADLVTYDPSAKKIDANWEDVLDNNQELIDYPLKGEWIVIYPEVIYEGGY